MSECVLSGVNRGARDSGSATSCGRKIWHRRRCHALYLWVVTFILILFIGVKLWNDRTNSFWSVKILSQIQNCNYRAHCQKSTSNFSLVWGKLNAQLNFYGKLWQVTCILQFHLVDYYNEYYSLFTIPNNSAFCARPDSPMLYITGTQKPKKMLPNYESRIVFYSSFGNIQSFFFKFSAVFSLFCVNVILNRADCERDLEQTSFALFNIFLIDLIIIDADAVIFHHLVFSLSNEVTILFWLLLVRQ